MLDKARIHLRQKLANKPKQKEIPLLQPHHLYSAWTTATKPVVIIGKQLGDVVKRSPAPRWFKVVGDKVVDSYFSVSRVVAQQKENIEDKLAERKVRSRSRSRSK